MTKELAREVSGFYLSSPCEVWWIAESVLNMSRSKADGTMSSWLLYFRNFTNFHTVSYITWTPLWTKCVSAAAILSNISADETLGRLGEHSISWKPLRYCSTNDWVLSCCKWLQWFSMTKCKKFTWSTSMITEPLSKSLDRCLK